MKFSITFKYQNVTFKNKETKETVTYDTKAEGNTFAFDNVDEDVVIGIVKGIKNKKAADVFAFDNFRTNFINVLARNKCKELYDKLDKGEWKIEDVTVSNITIKDVEFTKPTMNARETITVESKQRNPYFGNKFDIGESVFYKDTGQTYFVQGIDTRTSPILYDIMGDDGEEIEDVPEDKLDYGYMESKDMKKLNVTREHFEKSEYYQRKYGKLKFISESGDKFKTDKGNVVMFKESDIYDKIQKSKDEDYNELVSSVRQAVEKLDILIGKDYINDELREVRQILVNSLPDTIALRKMRERVSENKHNDTMEVIFKKDRKMGEVLAFFPDTINDGSCNPGNIMCYAHNGQHGEASIDYFHECKPCSEGEYADLLHELEGIYDDCELVVKRRANFR